MSESAETYGNPSEMSEGKQMTAVEWLEAELVKLEATVGVHNSMYELIEKAKEMEKEQIIDSFVQGVSVPYMEAIGDRRLWVSPQDPTIDAEQYYNETFGKP